MMIFKGGDKMIKQRFKQPALIVVGFLLCLTQAFAQEDNQFAANSESWELVLKGGGEATSEIKDSANCVTITNGGRDAFGVQLTNAGISMIEDETYTLSFDAYATVEKPIKLKVGQTASPFEGFWTQDAIVTTEKQTFTYSVRMSKPNEENAKLSLFLGGALPEGETNAEVCFENVSWSRGEKAAELLVNGDFAAEELTPWQLNTSDGGEGTAEVVDGAYCVTVASAASEPWSLAVMSGTFGLGAGKVYELSFDASSDTSSMLGVKLGQSAAPFEQYFYQTQQLTPELTRYTLKAEIDKEDKSARLELFLGGENTPKVPTTLCLDNFSLTEILLTGEKREIPYIMIDQFGYRPTDMKVAVLVDPQEGFNADDSFEPSGKIEVRRADDDSVVYSDYIIEWNDGETQANSGDKGWHFDFSEVDEPGSYYLADPENDMRSYTFEIAEDVYKDVLVAAVRMFYYNRANIAKEEPYADSRWTDGETFLSEGQDTEARFVDERDNEGLARDLSGGWFDAGDQNKYVTFANTVVHQLLTSFEENPEVYTDDFNIPESGNGIADILDEVKWELEWLKKMQNDDGGVLIKMGNIDYNSVLPLSEDKRPRFYGPVCSSSSIDTASMFAHAALVFSEIPELEGEVADLQERALAAFEWYEKNPKREDCDLGVIKAGDADRSVIEQEASKVVAAVYLFALTGEKRFSDAVTAGYRVTRAFNDGQLPRWGMYALEQGDALLYYTRLDNAEPETVRDILGERARQVKDVSPDIYGYRPEQDLYRAYMRDNSLHWGSNFPRASLGNVNLNAVHYDLEPDTQTYTDKALGIVNYFHGVNPFNMVYLSNMYDYGAEYSANEIYHLWFKDGSMWDNALTSERGPAPGYVPGGPNQFFSGDSSPPIGEPAQKAYRDWNGNVSYEITEPAIYYQAAYVRLLANFVGK
jgi:endoglucanase